MRWARIGSLVILGFMLSGVIFAGCHLVEVNMVQRNLMDKGDGKDDSYSKTGDSALDEESMELVVPIR